MMDEGKEKILKIMSVSFSRIDFDSILIAMNYSIRSKIRKGYISITNTESMYHALKLNSHLKYINNADFSCCDGIGVVIAARFLGIDIPRLHGPDLMLKSCEYGVKRKWKHFFYGGRKGIPELIKENMTRKFPGMKTAGMYSPPFRELTEDEDKVVIKMINDAKPDILWVGLGLLKQEKWIAEHRDRLDVSWIVGVGAAFDFYAGTVKRAPEFFRNHGLEWLYRVAFEPRMIIRNILSFKLLFMILWFGLKNHKIRFDNKMRAN